MTQRELAEALGISPGMVSRLVKRGRPTDSLERAQRWRKRHLEPGRVKGSRFDPNTPKAPASHIRPMPVAAASLASVASRIEALVHAAEAELIEASNPPELVDLEPLRNALRAWPCDAVRIAPAMPIRVWIALTEHAISEDSQIRLHHEQGLRLSAAAFASLVRTNQPDELSVLWFVIACDDPARYKAE